MVPSPSLSMPSLHFFLPHSLSNGRVVEVVVVVDVGVVVVVVVVVVVGGDIIY